MVHLNYKDNDFSISERERFLLELEGNSNYQGVLVKTCNRVELYSGDGYVSKDIVCHLFSVVSGLRSSFVGDTSIQGQVKSAYIQACDEKRVNKTLHKLFQRALFVGKKVRTQTGISEGAVTYPQAALEILCRNIQGIENKNITILGVHNINESIVQCLTKKGISTIFIGNRTLQKATVLAQRFNCLAFPWSKLSDRLQETDILITATSAPHEVIKPEIFPKNKPMFIIDLAVPRDVDHRIGALPGVFLFNVEMVEGQMSQNICKRQDQLKCAQFIVDEEVEKFMKFQEVNYAKQN